MYFNVKIPLVPSPILSTTACIKPKSKMRHSLVISKMFNIKNDCYQLLYIYQVFHGKERTQPHRKFFGD